MTITKKIYRTLPETNYLRSNNNFSLFIKLKRFNFFILKYRQILHKYYCDIKQKTAATLHKNIFKKKNKLFLSNYLCYLDMKISGILYHTMLVPKIKLLKQYLFRGYILVNNELITNYHFRIHPLDIISVQKNIKDSFFLVNKTLKKSMIYKYLFLKEFSLLLIYCKRSFNNIFKVNKNNTIINNNPLSLFNFKKNNINYINLIIIKFFIC